MGTGRRVRDQMRRYGFTEAEISAKDPRIWDIYNDKNDNSRLGNEKMTFGALALVEDIVKRVEVFNLISTDGVIDPAKFIEQAEKAENPLLLELVQGLVDLSLPTIANGK